MGYAKSSAASDMFCTKCQQWSTMVDSYSARCVCSVSEDNSYELSSAYVNAYRSNLISNRDKGPRIE